MLAGISKSLLNNNLTNSTRLIAVFETCSLEEERSSQV